MPIYCMASSTTSQQDAGHTHHADDQWPHSKMVLQVMDSTRLLTSAFKKADLWHSSGPPSCSSEKEQKRIGLGWTISSPLLGFSFFKKKISMFGLLTTRVLKDPSQASQLETSWLLSSLCFLSCSFGLSESLRSSKILCWWPGCPKARQRLRFVIHLCLWLMYTSGLQGHSRCRMLDGAGLMKLERFSCCT